MQELPLVALSLFAGYSYLSCAGSRNNRYYTNCVPSGSLSFFVCSLGNCDTLNGEVFKRYITGAVDSTLGDVTGNSEMHRINNMMLKQVWELWQAPRANAYAQVLFVFCMAFAGNLVKHTGLDSFGATVVGVAGERTTAIRAAKSLLKGGKGVRTKEDVAAQAAGTTELEFIQAQFDKILVDLEAGCAKALRTHGDLKKFVGAASTKTMTTSAAAPTAPTAAAGQVPAAPQAVMNKLNQLSEQMSAARKDKSRWDMNDKPRDNRQNDRRPDNREGDRRRDNDRRRDSNGNPT